MKPFVEYTLPRKKGDYAENDVYYLEVCVLSELCANSDELWTKRVGENWACTISMDKWKALQVNLQRHG